MIGTGHGTLNVLPCLAASLAIAVSAAAQDTGRSEPACTTLGSAAARTRTPYPVERYAVEVQ